MKLSDTQKMEILAITTQQNLFAYRIEAIGMRVHNVNYKLFTAILIIGFMQKAKMNITQVNYAVIEGIHKQTAHTRFKELLEKGYLLKVNRYRGFKLSPSGQAIYDYYVKHNSEYWKKLVNKIEEEL